MVRKGLGENEMTLGDEEDGTKWLIMGDYIVMSCFLPSQVEGVITWH